MKENFERQNRSLAVFKALANANRLKIIKFIANSKTNELTVNEISDLLEISQPATSAHLKLLRFHRIIKAKQSSSQMFYSLRNPDLIKLINNAEEL